MESNEQPSAKTSSQAPTGAEVPAAAPTPEPRGQIVPAHQGSLELLDAKWDVGSGRTAKFRLVPNGKPYIDHPFRDFVQRRGGRLGTRFRAAFIRVGESSPYYVGEVMLAGGGNPLQAGMWVKFWFDEDSVFPSADELKRHSPAGEGANWDEFWKWLRGTIKEHPFEGCTARSNTEPGDLFDAVFLELDDDDNIVDPTKRAEVERLAHDQHESHALARYAALLGTNALFVQWLSEEILLPTKDAPPSTRPVSWWNEGDHVARWIRWICQVESRSDLDRNVEAARRFHQHVREPYNNWRHMRED